MTMRPLGTVTEIIESAGMDVSYAYEDLIFLEQNGFLLQFTDRESEVLVHFNDEVLERALTVTLALLQKKAKERSMVFSRGGYFRRSKTDDKRIRIEFYPSSGKFAGKLKLSAAARC